MTVHTVFCSCFVAGQHHSMHSELFPSACSLTAGASAGIEASKCVVKSQTWAFKEDTKAHVGVQDCLQLGTGDEPVGHNILQITAATSPAVCYSFCTAGVWNCRLAQTACPDLQSKRP